MCHTFRRSIHHQVSNNLLAALGDEISAARKGGASLVERLGVATGARWNAGARRTQPLACPPGFVGLALKVMTFFPHNNTGLEAFALGRMGTTFPELRHLHVGGLINPSFLDGNYHMMSACFPLRHLCLFSLG